MAIDYSKIGAEWGGEQGEDPVQDIPLKVVDDQPEHWPDVIGNGGEMFGMDVINPAVSKTLSLAEQAAAVPKTLKESFTGENQMVATTEALSDWQHIPEFNTDVGKGMMSLFGQAGKAILGPFSEMVPESVTDSGDFNKNMATGMATTTASPEEIAQIFKNNYGLDVRQDEKQNWVITSNIDGKDYAIKPGFRPNDAVRAVTAALMFAPSGWAKTFLGRLGTGLGMEMGNEAVQYSQGGEFNPVDAAI